MKKFWRGVWRILKPIVVFDLRLIGWILWPLGWVLAHKPVRPVLETIAGGGLWRKVPGFTHRVAEHLGILYIAVFAVDTGCGTVLPGSWLALVALPCMSVTMAALSHRDYLCLACAEESPANPSEEAEHHRADLRRFHRLSLPLMIAFLVLVIGVTAALGDEVNEYVTDLFGAVCVFVLFLPAFRWIQVHKRYEAWCPWCHPGDGGDDDDEFEPVGPDPYTKELVS